MLWFIQASARGLVSLMLLLVGAAGAAYGQNSCVKNCRSSASDAPCSGFQGAQRAKCVAQCEHNCLSQPTPTPPPPLLVRPKYIVAAIVYAPPGCASATPNTPCSQPGLVDYSGTSSMGSKVTVADSFKNGVKVTASFGSEFGGGGGSFGWSRTTGDTSFANLTKSGSLEIKVPGNGDGVNHDQDMIELLLNPTATLSSDGGTNIFWQPGYAGDSVARYEVFVSELRNPATMRPTVAKELKKLGLTAADYKTMRCLDRFAGPGVSGPGGSHADFCQMPVSTGGSSSPGLDLHRFGPTTWILPYEPPVHATDLCPSITATLKNEYSSEDAKSTQDEYSVSADMGVGVDAVWKVKIEGTMTWTSGETDTSSQGSTQSAALTLVCPSVGYTGPTLFQVFWDVLYGTFLFMPYDPSTMEITQRGVVVDNKGKPLAGLPVALEYSGHTYHTFTTPTGHYRFIGLKRLIKPAVKKGTISVRDVKRPVALRSGSSTTVRLQ